MEQTSLALLVFDPQDGKVFDTVGYWQNALRKVARAGNVAGILVAARCDRPGLRLTIDEVREWAAARGLHGPILTAAKLKKHPGAARTARLDREAAAVGHDGVSQHDGEFPRAEGCHPCRARRQGHPAAWW